MFSLCYSYCQLSCRPVWVGLVSLVSACQVAKCLQRVVGSKKDFLSLRRFLVNIFVKYKDHKVRQRGIIKCDRFKDYKELDYKLR